MCMKKIEPKNVKVNNVDELINAIDVAQVNGTIYYKGCLLRFCEDDVEVYDAGNALLGTFDQRYPADLPYPELIESDILAFQICDFLGFDDDADYIVEYHLRELYNGDL